MMLAWEIDAEALELLNSLTTIKLNFWKTAIFFLVYVYGLSNGQPNPLQALFRKIAAALPGMETLSSTKQEDMVDVNLKSTGSGAAQSQPQSGGCAC